MGLLKVETHLGGAETLGELLAVVDALIRHLDSEYRRHADDAAYCGVEPTWEQIVARRLEPVVVPKRRAQARYEASCRVLGGALLQLKGTKYRRFKRICARYPPSLRSWALFPRSVRQAIHDCRNNLPEYITLRSEAQTLRNEMLSGSLQISVEDELEEARLAHSRSRDKAILAQQIRTANRLKRKNAEVTRDWLQAQVANLGSAKALVSQSLQAPEIG